MGRRRLSLINAEPLEPLFREAYWAACSTLPVPPQCPPLRYPLMAEGCMKGTGQVPQVLFTSERVAEMVKDGHRFTTQGKFSDALARFRCALQALPLSVASDADEERRLTDMVDMCRQYGVAMRLEVTRKALGPTQVARSVELAAFLACCKLLPQHRLLTLRVAMSTAFKAQNFITAAAFARVLVTGGLGIGSAPQDVVSQARNLLAACDQKGTDAHAIRLDVKAIEEFRMCAGSFVPIAPTEPTVVCPFCGSTFGHSYKGKLCETCQLCEIGANALGIQFRPI